MLYGFMGFRPRSDGFEINPQLPKDWPQLEITQIYLHDMVIDISAGKDSISITTKSGQSEKPFFVYLPMGKWYVNYIDLEGKASESIVIVEKAGQGIPVKLETCKMLRIIDGN